MQPGFAVAHALWGLAHLRSLLRLGLYGSAQARLFRPVGIVLKAGEFHAPFAFGAVGGVVSREDFQFSVAQLGNRRAHAVEQRAIVAHKQKRALVGKQLRAQQFNALCVQVGGGLVGQQNMRPCRERGGNAPARLFAAGEAVTLFLRLKDRADARVEIFGVVVSGLPDIGYRPQPVHMPAFRLDLSGQNAQKCGFSRAVFAHKADAVALVQSETVDRKEFFHAKGKRNTVCFQKDLCQGASLPVSE